MAFVASHARPKVYLFSPGRAMAAYFVKISKLVLATSPRAASISDRRPLAIKKNSGSAFRRADSCWDMWGDFLQKRISRCYSMRRGNSLGKGTLCTSCWWEMGRHARLFVPMPSGSALRITSHWQVTPPILAPVTPRWMPLSC
ncbi:hypothetical protein THTE_1531 [Thermogutta terrifontis]|uniref:Uncharacterized protein n=1 Tax=Thermogutta terrifontis TaxID=1331910 RepID=A0A286RDX2_9BACT|nr:hypothetical protein THTE_1531 [Thermogutta terrifontis]